MGRIGLNGRRGDACLAEFAADKLGHFSLLAAAARNGHQLQHQFQGSPHVGLIGQVTVGCRLHHVT